MNGEYTPAVVKQLIAMHRKYDSRVSIVTPTAAQIDAAQRAGNAAYDAATDLVGAYEAYRCAYDDTLYRLMSDDMPDGIIEQYSSATEGAWM